MNTHDARDAKNDIVAVAEAMIAGQMPLIEGARRLCDLRHKIGASDSPLFDPIVGFEEETSDYPTDSRRELYSKKLLAEIDQEIQSYVSDARLSVISDCTKIIAAMRINSTDS